MLYSQLNNHQSIKWQEAGNNNNYKNDYQDHELLFAFGDENLGKTSDADELEIEEANALDDDNDLESCEPVSRNIRVESSKEEEENRDRYITSPSRLDGSDILRDLGEMSDCADRIDSILDQRQPSIGPDGRRLRSVSPAYLSPGSPSAKRFLGYNEESLANNDDDDDEVD